MGHKFSMLIILSIILAFGCDFSTKPIKTEALTKNSQVKSSQTDTTQNNKISADIYGDKNSAGIKVKIEEDKFGIVEISFNGRKLEKVTEAKLIEFRGSRLTFQKDNELIFTIKDNKTQLFKIPFEPLDFAAEEPFVFHRTTSNALKLSKIYDSPNELWLGIKDNYIGGFKEIAEFNETKDSIIIPDRVANRMSVGDAEISLYDVRWGKLESQNGAFPIKYNTRYESKIKLNVVR